ncbi:hypothetical protein BGX38DRAFT_1141965 [Terfezia claveryi]|nr:hypothetical protein BGX38DRAFT_1141965 [Terfezia claveryi]
MASPLRGVVFGPVEDWGKRSCKLLLELDGGEEVKKRRQYVLEEVASWAGVREFGERGVRALDQAMSNTEQARREWQGEGDWYGPSAERAVEILLRAIGIQDGSVNGQLDGYDVDYQTTDKDDGILEYITVRPAKATGGAIFGVAHNWTLTTPKSKKKVVEVKPVKMEVKLEVVDEEREGESENETMRRKGKKWRGLRGPRGQPACDEGLDGQGSKEPNRGASRGARTKDRR